MTVERDQWCGDREEIMWGEDRRESSGFSLEESLVALMRRALVVKGGLTWVGDEDAARAHQPLQKLTMKPMEVEERLGGRSLVSSVSIQERAARSRGEGAL